MITTTLCTSVETTSNRRRPFYLLTSSLLGVATLCFTSGCSDKQATVSSADTNTVNGVHVSEYRRTAFWSGVLQQHPDLPEKVRRIVDTDATKQTHQRDVPGAKVTIHSYLGPVTVKAESISAIVTDLDGQSLRKLLAYWQTVPERARELGLAPKTRDPQKPRVIVLGQEGKVEIKGSTGTETQTIDVYPEPLTGQAAFEIHSFGEKGNAAIASLLEYLQRANQSRGPPTADVKSGKYDRPPPEEVPVVIVGKLKELDIQGASGSSKQTVTIEEYINGFTETETTKEVIEFAKVGESAFRVKATEVAAAAVAASVAKKSYESRSERPSSSGGSRPSGGRRGGARPGR